jgi:hypothetical protein
MSFVLPAKYSEDTPIPKDSTVSIKTIPAKTVAVTVFSGYSSEIVLHIHITDGRGETLVDSLKVAWSSMLQWHDIQLHVFTGTLASSSAASV